MGLFDKFFGSPSDPDINENVVKWENLTDLSQLDQIIEESNKKIIVIFKMSTRCGVSRMAFNVFEKDFDYNEEQVKCYYLDILNYRTVSNEVADRFKIIHESPQLLVLKNGRVIDDKSHGNIDAKSIEKYL